MPILTGTMIFLHLIHIAQPLLHLSTVQPATPVSLQSPEFPVQATSPVPPVIPDTRPGFVSASSTASEFLVTAGVSPVS